MTVRSWSTLPLRTPDEAFTWDGCDRFAQTWDCRRETGLPEMSSSGLKVKSLLHGVRYGTAEDNFGWKFLFDFRN